MAHNSESRQSRSEVPEVVINRLPQYVRILNRLLDDGTQVVSSQQLGEKLQVTPAQIRKDLSYFGRFGKQGRGYSVRDLLDRLRQILGINSPWNVAVVGVGRLGRAILSYPGFNPDGFTLVAAFAPHHSVGGGTGGGDRHTGTGVGAAGAAVATAKGAIAGGGTAVADTPHAVTAKASTTRSTGIVWGRNLTLELLIIF